MVLGIQDWKFEIDVTATMEYSTEEAKGHCLCAYCRNFYASIDAVYPSLRGFLGKFGLDIEAPDEMIPFFPPTDCDAYYAVCGKILHVGTQNIFVDSLLIVPQTEQEAMVNTGLHAPRFFLWVQNLRLPWVLEESMEEAISPANEPLFMERTLQRLLSEAPNSEFIT